jgi:hypothetical protein
VEDVSPALLATIESEFEKVSKMDPPQPTKGAVTAIVSLFIQFSITYNHIDLSLNSLAEEETMIEVLMLVPVTMQLNHFFLVSIFQTP